MRSSRAYSHHTHISKWVLAVLVLLLLVPFYTRGDSDTAMSNSAAQTLSQSSQIR